MIYLDNAASSWPKPDCVTKAMENYLKDFSANPGRSGHKLARLAGNVVLSTRQRLAALINSPSSERIVFTLNATEALNTAILGIVKPKDHVITTSMEHNSILRPLNYAAKQGVEVEIVACDGNGLVDPEKIKSAMKRNTKLIALGHASNVTGTIQPIQEIGEIAREADVPFLLDAAQTAGAVSIDVQKQNVSLLAITGHKSLLGPQGTGALYVADGLTVNPLKYGGTGSYSELEEQPYEFPDYLESGTLNGVGIAGLGAALSYIEERGLSEIINHKKDLIFQLISGLAAINNIKIYGHVNGVEAVPVVSFSIIGCDSSEIAFILDSVYDIAVRPGLHCAPLAHKTIGTFPEGTIRVSLSVFNNKEEIAAFISAIREIVKDMT